MPTVVSTQRVSNHLDLIRGMAACAVLFYHIRYRFFWDYQDLVEPHLWTKVFYTLTAFGHDAVIVFFVLSGYFISASVIRAKSNNRWSWTSYLSQRLTRLYVVLLPGLILTLFWDFLGLCLFPNSVIYTGASRSWSHDFFAISERLDWSTFAGNLLFLQSIAVSPFGSNDPLWSLTFEFWYYLLFPCAWLAIIGRPRTWRSLVSIVLVTLGLLLTGKTVALYFPIWLMGSAVYLLPRIVRGTRHFPTLVVLCLIGTCSGAVAATHTAWFKETVGSSLIAADYATALSFTVILYILLHDTSPSVAAGYARFSGWLAGMSFTLYVVHMPLLVFLRAALLTDEPLMPTVSNIMIAIALAGLCLIYAYCISWLFEARTAQVRRWVTNSWQRPGAERLITAPPLQP